MMTLSNMVRGFHLRYGSHEDLQSFKDFIKKVLVPRGINLIFLECNVSFRFQSHPELSEGTLTKEDARELQLLCKENDVRLVPLFQCLGHQGWGGARNSILKTYPEFDETPHIAEDAKWPEFFCPSWCPEHPDVNALAFELIDELIDAFAADAFHIGMDEVFALADDQCPRCKGKARKDQFAKAVNDMYDHIVKKRGLEMFMWGDRLIDSEETGYRNRFESDSFGTAGAIDLIPNDIVICDWHYLQHKSFPSPRIFMEKGFKVLPACWFDTKAAVDFLEQSQKQAEELEREDLLPGMIITSWHHWDKEAFESFYPENMESLEGDIKELSDTLVEITNRL